MKTNMRAHRTIDDPQKQRERRCKQIAAAAKAGHIYHRERCKQRKMLSQTESREQTQ